jgi:hypothetical protein
MKKLLTFLIKHIYFWLVKLPCQKNHAPVVTKGDSGTSSSVNVGLPPATPYFVYVLPKSGYAMGGAPVP